MKETDPERFRVTYAEFIAGTDTLVALPPPMLAEIAFGGRSNVGKSTLLNMMMERKNLVRTSSKPGHTRQINLFHVKTKAALELNFVDLPGYGFAKISKAAANTWGPLIEGYLLSRPTLRGFVLLVDARRGLEDDDRALIEFLGLRRERNPFHVFIAATKIDKMPRHERKPVLAALAKSAGVRVFGVSGETAEGRPELFAALAKAAIGASNPAAFGDPHTP